MYILSTYTQGPNFRYFCSAVSTYKVAKNWKFWNYKIPNDVRLTLKS